MSSQKNSTLELIKLFASYMVVFIHVSFYGKFGDAIDAIARFAVPFFFLVSGFYSYQIDCEKIKSRIKSILTLLIVGTICYNIFETATLLRWNHEGLVARLDKFADLKTYIDLFVYNMPVSSGHLWYLWAILYVYIIFYFVTKFRVKEKIIFAVSFILLFLHILLGEVLSVFGIVVPMLVVRNFALMGIPFFASGLFVKKYEHKFRAIPDYVIVASIITGAFESIISRFCFGVNELFAGSVLILFATVCIFTKYANAEHPAYLTSLYGCSTYIYIFHIMISGVFNIAYGVLGVNIYSSLILENLHPIVVCISSTIFAYLIIRALNIYKKIKLNKSKAR